jgi:hypothetical protein
MNWQREKQAALAEIERCKAEIAALEKGLDLGRIDLGGTGLSEYVALEASASDEQFFNDFYKNKLVTTLLGSGPGQGQASLGEAGPDEVWRGGTADAGGVGAGGVSNSASAGRKGVLAFLTTRFGLASFLSTRPLWVGVVGGSLLVLGLLTLMMLLASSEEAANANEEIYQVTAQAALRRATATANAANTTLVNGSAGSPLAQATITVQAATITALLSRPSPTPALVVATPSPTRLAATSTPAVPTATPTLDLSQAPHGGLLAPSGVNARAVGFANSAVVRYRAYDSTTTGSVQADGIGAPPKGTLYHYGAYPGERPGNVVLIGDYDTLGQYLELLQINDLVEVSDRNGGVYTYRVLDYERVGKLAGLFGSSSDNPNPTAGATNGNGEAGRDSGDGAKLSTTAVVGGGNSLGLATGDGQVEKITTFDDTGLIAKPTKPGYSMLTLVSLAKPLSEEEAKKPENGRRLADTQAKRLAVRAEFVSYRPVPNLPPGTPVVNASTQAALPTLLSSGSTTTTPGPTPH